MERSGSPPPPPPPSPVLEQPVPHEAVADPFDRQEKNHDVSICEEAASSRHPRLPKLSFLEIPSRSLESSSLCSTGLNIPPSLTPRSTITGLPPKPPPTRQKPSTPPLQSSTAKMNSTPKSDRTTAHRAGNSLHGQQDKPSILTLSFGKAWNSISAK
ncbi:hypothetical protein HPP92_016565 [Vanilla planifolia]|uniref:Uncharacterized protein n=1 Tax=Vanilla planifolia TaxID=51239 RepID=A0A835QB43_VANPL|nr:hypothetical protein HPP92_016565 [Vanilla planifolia]